MLRYFSLILIFLGSALIAQVPVAKSDSILILEYSQSEIRENSLNRATQEYKRGDMDEAVMYLSRFCGSVPSRCYKSRNNRSVFRAAELDTVALELLDNLVAYDTSLIIKSNRFYANMLLDPESISDKPIEISGFLDLDPQLHGYNKAILLAKQGNYRASNHGLSQYLESDSLIKLLDKEDLSLIRANNYFHLGDTATASKYYARCTKLNKNWGGLCIGVYSNSTSSLLSGLVVPDDNKRLLLNQGQLFLMTSAPQKALGAYEKVLILDSLNIEAQLGIASAFIQKRQFDTVDVILDQVLDYELTREEMARAFNVRGVSLYSQSKAGKALLDFEKAHALSPSRNEITYNCLLASYQESNYDDAYEYYKELRENSYETNSVEEFALFSLITYINGDFEEAESLVDDLLYKDKNHDIGNLIKGLLMGRYETLAVPYFEQAKKSKSTVIRRSALELIGANKVYNYDYEGALVVYKSLVAWDAENYLGYNGLALAYSGLKQYSKAKRNILKAKSLCDDAVFFDNLICNESYIYYSQGKSLNQSNSGENSTQIIDSAIAILKTASISFNNNLGLYHYEKDDVKMARYYFELSEDESSLNNLGVLASKNGKYKKAKKFYDQSIELDPRFYLFRSNRYINNSRIGAGSTEDKKLAMGNVEAVTNKPIDEQFSFVFNVFYKANVKHEMEADPKFIYEIYPPNYPGIKYPFYLFSDDYVFQSARVRSPKRLGKYKGECPPHLKFGKKHRDLNGGNAVDLLDTLVVEVVSVEPNERTIETLAYVILEDLQRNKASLDPLFLQNVMTLMGELKEFEMLQGDFISFLESLVKDGLMPKSVVEEYKNLIRN